MNGGAGNRGHVGEPRVVHSVLRASETMRSLPFVKQEGPMARRLHQHSYQAFVEHVDLDVTDGERVLCQSIPYQTCLAWINCPPSSSQRHKSRECFPFNKSLDMIVTFH